MTTTHTKRLVLSTAILAACARGALAEDIDLHKALAPCSAISSDADRVACYDKLAGRVPVPKARPSLAAPVPAPAAPVAAAPVPAPATPVEAAPVPAAAPTEEDFGRSKLQMAARSPAGIKTVTAKVAAFGRSPNLRPQVTLDNGQIWEYQDAPDPLLSIGDSVIVKHGTLGSFLLLTPAKYSHRVRRIN